MHTTIRNTAKTLNPHISINFEAIAMPILLTEAEIHGVLPNPDILQVSARYARFLWDYAPAQRPPLNPHLGLIN